ncbi:DUF3630 family protein [Vibrio quintilis]|uniref:DUF3630 domain-containing protein n=1 Tax=Vibrio quintilis TaxID=1117707 RepID=A0A1M7Z040_9VIBR|nr:hypothetical protein VQ7734_04049 [Vibrio quintilis]
MVKFCLAEYLRDDGVLILATPDFDFDSFPSLGETLVSLLSAHIKEKQTDADLHTWLIDFEGTSLFLKAEHYSGSIWLEALQREQSFEVLDYIAEIFRQEMIPIEC